VPLQNGQPLASPQPDPENPIARLASALVGLVLLSTSLLAQAPPTQGDAPSVEDRYVALSAAGDRAGLVALWAEDPEAVVPTIDKDLEGSLALWEEGGEAKRAEIDALMQRATVAASAALEATGRRRVLDYVTSFTGWDDDQKRTFRAGQQACRTGSGAMREGNVSTALARAEECRALAEPLGDWWGTAMGLRLEGAALGAAGERERAATALSRSRLIFRELGLTSSALRIEADLAEILLELGHTTRAEAMIRDGASTAARLGLGEIELRFKELGGSGPPC